MNQFIREQAPDGIRGKKHGVESTFCIVLAIQIALCGIWAWSFSQALQSNIDLRYLALTKSTDAVINGNELCKPVKM
jgi:hypothetical protein